MICGRITVEARYCRYKQDSSGLKHLCYLHFRFLDTPQQLLSHRAECKSEIYLYPGHYFGLPIFLVFSSVLPTIAFDFAFYFPSTPKVSHLQGRDFIACLRLIT